MSKALVIAEKPSVALDITRALGGFKKTDDYYEGKDYVVSSAVGHLIELREPERVDKPKKGGKWSFANLPVLPEEFDLQPIDARAESRFKLLKKLMKREDVTTIINACDAGREGELIFRYLVKLAGIKKPIRRLWLQSMTQNAIRTAFQKLRTDEEMIPLAKAAFSRAESDWLVGINATRAMTAFNSKEGGFQLTPVGRVQTPTLTILVEREEKIRNFKPRTYHEVHAEFGVSAGQYHGRWFDPTFRRANTTDEAARAERIWEQDKAEAIQAKCHGKPGIITEEKKPSTQAPPLLYDLTTLQREASTRFGFSAKRTLQLAQQLYERYKVLTYPRTDSRYLPEDYLSTVKETLGHLGLDNLDSHAQKALSQGWVRMNRRVFDNTKVSDHSAIIPTGQSLRGLDEYHLRLYELVARRFIAVFYPAAQFEITTRITEVEQEKFKTEGRIIKDPGWLAVYGKQASDVKSRADQASGEEGSGAGKELIAVKPNEKADTLLVEVHTLETKPPARYTEATLLSTMEGAGKLVDDEELREAMSEKGLGTPATRAAIIEGLLHDGYVIRQARDLAPTTKGISLITLLRSIGASALCSPEMTGEWEARLKRMEHGDLRRREFMVQIRDLTRDIVERARGFEGIIEGNFVELEAVCPKCNAGPLREEYRAYHCPNCDYIFWKTIAGRQFSPEEVQTLLAQKMIGPLEGFRNKMGRLFAARVRLNDEGKPEFDFEDAIGGAGSGSEPLDLSKYPAIGLCPVCKKHQVYALEMAYVCEGAIGTKKDCNFRVSKMILQQEISQEQVSKIITEGKSDKFTKFISKRGRPFSAFLKLEPSGKVGFEFPPRAGDAAGKKPAGKSKTKEPKPKATAKTKAKKKTDSD